MNFFRREPRLPSGRSQADVFAIAVAMGELEVIRSALEHKVDVNAIGKDGTPPLVIASAKGHEEVVGLLLAAGADVNATDRDGGMTALHAATASGQIGIVRQLIAGRAKIDATFGRPPMTAMSIAFRRGTRDILRALLDAGANPNISIASPSDPPEQQGITPLIYAAASGDVEMLRLLIRYGADLNAAKADGLTPLMVAAFCGQFDSIKVLVEAGAKVELVNTIDPAKPFSAMDLAVVGGHNQIVGHLKRKCDVPTPKLNDQQ